MDRSRREALGWTALALLVALVPWRSFLSAGVPVCRDLTGYFYPMKVHLAEALRSGEIPWLDPTRWGGAPLLALPGAQAFYPANLLFVLLPAGTAMKSWMLLHLALGTVGFAALARRIGLGAGPAAVGGAALALSGVTVSVQAFPTSASALAWTPWLALAVCRSAREPGAAAAVRLALVTGVILTTAAPEYLFCGGLFAVALAFAHASEGGRGRGEARGLLRSAAPILGGLVLGAFLAAPTLLGSVATALPSVRGPGGGTNERFAARGALPPTRLAEFLGDDLVADWSVSGAGPAGEQYPYFPSLTPGAVGLALAGAGLLAGGVGRGAAAALSVFGVLLALGPATPVWKGTLFLVPPLRVVRYPEKYAVLVTIGVAWLGALGVAALAARLPSRLKGAASVLALGLLLAERGGAARRLFPLEPPERLTHPPAVLAPVLALAVPGQPPPRVFQQDRLVPLPVWNVDVATADRQGIRSAAPEYGTLFGVAYVFEEDYDLSLPREATDWLLLLGRAFRTTSPLPRTVVRSAGASATIRTSPIRTGVGVPELQLEPDPLPPYRFAARVVADADYQRLLSRYLADACDPSCAYVFLDEADRGGRGPVPAGAGTVLAVRDAPSALSIDVEVAGPGTAVLTLARLFEACREATLDGRPVEVLEANFGFSAVEVPAGRHRLVLRPPSGWLHWGMGISCAALLVLAGLGLRSAASRRPESA